MQRILVTIANREQWYVVVREANTWFGAGNWRGQRRVKRKLQPQAGRFGIFLQQPQKIWFEIPDIQFASWLTLKYTLPVTILKDTDSEVAE
jgi:hypothetical protein